MVMRFRLSGTNWEGRQWAVTKPIVKLAWAISDAYPNPHGADGTVASRLHDMNNPRSDHRPKPYRGFGWVRAIDIGVTSTEQGLLIASVLSLDDRINYVLFGDDAHKTHVHASMEPDADNDERTWYVFTQAEVKILKEMCEGIREKKSNGGFVIQCIDDIRQKNDADVNHGGYARRDELSSSGDGLRRGDTVKLT